MNVGSGDARNINSEQIDFELANVKRIVGLDSKKLDYKDMTDKELNKNQSMNYSFKFMETQADKDFMKKVMNQRLAQALNKLQIVRKQVGGVGGRLNASINNKSF